MKQYTDGLQHIGIPTTAMDATIEFYGKIGFEVIYETTLNEKDRVVFMKLGNLCMEFYEVEKAALCNGAVDHVAINCTDIDAAFAEAGELGFTILEGITFLPFFEKGVKFFICEGPNRERVEFNQFM